MPCLLYSTGGRALPVRWVHFRGRTIRGGLRLTFVTSPYRDERATLLRRRVALREELSEIDRRLKQTPARRRFSWGVAVGVLAALAALGILTEHAFRGTSCPTAEDLRHEPGEKPGPRTIPSSGCEPGDPLCVP
jgi:hypothetical protein